MTKSTFHREKAGARALRRGMRSSGVEATAALADVMNGFMGQRAPATTVSRQPQGRSYTRIAKSLSINGVDVRIQLRAELTPAGQPAEAVTMFRLDAEDDSPELRQRLVEERDRLLAALGREMGHTFAPRSVWDLHDVPDADEAGGVVADPCGRNP